MKPIKVYLQYPWKFPDSPYYKYLIENPPEGVEYLNVEKQKGVITNKRFFWISNFLKRNIRRFFNIFRLSIPNAYLSPSFDYDLIHCAHCLSKNTNKPWVADFEGVWQFYIGKEIEEAKKEVNKILLNKNLKRILCWTEEAKAKIMSEFPEVEDKLEVVYPAVPLRTKRKKQENKINLIFSGRYFYWKGGLDALETIDRITNKYPNVYGIINSDAPKEIITKYSGNNKISFYGLIPQKELFDLYNKSDILIYPGYSDSFGFAYLESMSFGIPVITVEGFARGEIIENGKTGFIIPKSAEIDYKSLNLRVIDLLVKKISELIDDKKLRNKMSKNCIEIIKNGKFSIKRRNSQLIKIYEEAIK